MRSTLTAAAMPQGVATPALLVLAIVLSGCAASLKGYPDPSTDPEGDLKQLAIYTSPDAIAKYEAVDPSAKRAWRNAVIEGRVMAQDIRFRQFQQRIYLEGTGSNIGGDWAILGLNGAGALAGGAANALAAASAGIVGARASFDKNAFYEKTLPALLATMDAKRLQVLARLRDGESKSIEDYPLSQALGDLAAYTEAGSIPGALTDITVASGTALQDAQLKAAVRFDKPDPADIFARKKNAADFVRSLAKAGKLSDIDRLATVFGVATGPPALPGILVEIDKAKDKAGMDTVSKKIQSAFPDKEL